MNTMQVIKTRRTCRAFKDDPVSGEDIRTVLEAANAAPIAMHDYETVQLSVITDRAVIDAVDALAGGKGGRMGTGPTYRAPVLILVSGEESSVENGTAYCNAGCVIENMSLAATELGLGSGYILGVIRTLQGHPELFDGLGVENGFLPVSAMTLGVPVDAGLLAEPREATTDNFVTHFVG